MSKEEPRIGYRWFLLEKHLCHIHPLSRLTGGKTLGADSVKGSPSPKKRKSRPGIPEELEVEAVVDVVEGEEGDVVYLESKESDCVETSEGESRNTFKFLGFSLIISRLLLLIHLTLQKRHQSQSNRMHKTRRLDPILAPRLRLTIQQKSRVPHLSVLRCQPDPCPLQCWPCQRSLPDLSDPLRKGRLPFENLFCLNQPERFGRRPGHPAFKAPFDHGNIVTRRKSGSRSPQRTSPVKAIAAELSNITITAAVAQDSVATPSRQPLQEIQWVMEDGMMDISISDSDSDKDSLEADVSLDIVSLRYHILISLLDLLT